MRHHPFRALLLAGCAALAAASAQAQDPLTDGFRDPPESARPRVWWHWMNGNVTQDGVDKDLAWMKRVGIGGLQNFDAALETPQVVDKRIVYMSPEWKSVFRHSAEEADRQGLELAIASSPGWSETGGPWVKPEQGMKKLVWSETLIRGGRHFHGPLAAPPSITGPFQNLPAPTGFLGHRGNKPLPTYYADTAVIAYRAPDTSPVPRPAITTSAGITNPAAITDGDITTSAKLALASGKPAWVLLDYGARQTMQSIRIASGLVPDLSPTSVQGTLEASDDGVTFRTVAEVGVGHAPQQTTSFAPVTARFFRLMLKSGPGSGGDMMSSIAPGADIAGLLALLGPVVSTPGFDLGEVSLSPQAQVNQFELKAGFALATDYYALEAPTRGTVSGVAPTDVLDVTRFMKPDGTLDWTPPKGRWQVLRLGYSLIGTENHPATEEATGLEVDKYNKADVKAYMETYLDGYAGFLGSGLIGKRGVRAMLNDSTEVGPQNWTDAMLAEFQTRRGYDPRPWLPALTGVVVGDAVRSDAFLYDFRKTLSDMMTDNHYAVVAEAAHARGLVTYGEALESSRNTFGDDMAMRRYTDVPMSAMWTYNRAVGPMATYMADIRGAASVAHVYGQNLVAAESMTSLMTPWGFTPRDLKPVIDLEFALGVNRPVVHTSVHQPLDRKPGLSLSIFGQYFNRNDTWAEQAGPWVGYIARNAFMLQQGRALADVAYFYGEEAPLVALYNQHEPADMPQGHGFDFVNAEVLAHQLTAGQLSTGPGVLSAPSGAQYRLLYLGGSSRHMTLATLQRIHDLVAAGAVVAGQRPVSSPALADDPAAFQHLADSMWRPGEPMVGIGAGKVIAATDPDEALNLIGLARDFDPGAQHADAQVMFLHRKLPDGDIYYVDNRKNRAEQLQARFRVEGKVPELWHADTGTSEPVSYAIKDGVTVVPLNLDPDESVFVVFRKPAPTPSLVVPAKVEKPLATVDGPWSVAFEAGRGAPATATFDHLASWTGNADAGIRYFSGAGTYSHTLDVSKAQLGGGRRVLLDLGDVRDLAEVRVNGTLVGTLWHPPYRIDVTDAVKAGPNRLEVKVVNPWANRLIGDKQPGAKPVTFTVVPTYTAQAPLRPSGLLGPVRLLAVEPAAGS